MQTSRWLYLTVLQVGLLSGCGLADYENHMDTQRNRLRIVDDENKYLGEVLEPPPPQNADTVKALPFDIFLRLPRGINRTIADKEGSFLINNDQFIYRYPGAKGHNVFLAATMVPNERTNEAGAESGPDSFRESFWFAVGTILSKNWRRPEKIERLSWQPTSYGPEKLPSASFDYFVFEDEPTAKDAAYVSFYFHQKGLRRIGLAFQIPFAQRNDIAAQKGIDLCVKSLDISDNASAKQKAFATFKRWD